MTDTVSLKEYFDKLREADQRAIQNALASAQREVKAALASSEKAVEKAEVSSNDRFEAANNVKATFSNDLARKLDRTEYDTNHKALEGKISDITDRINRSEGSSSGSELTKASVLAYLGVAVAIITVIVIWANHR